MIAGVVQAGGEPQGSGPGTGNAPGVCGGENGTWGSAEELTGARENSGEVRSRWTSLLASLGLAPQVLAEAGARRQVLSSGTDNREEGPELRACRNHDKRPLAGAGLKAIAGVNRDAGRPGRAESGSRQKNEITDKAAAGDTSAAESCSRAMAVVNAVLAMSPEVRPSADESPLPAPASNVCSTAIDNARLEMPVERLGITENLSEFHRADTQVQRNESAEVGSIANPIKPSVGVHGDGETHTAEHEPASRDGFFIGPDLIWGFRGHYAGGGSKPNPAATSEAQGTRLGTQVDAESPSVGAAPFFNLNREHSAPEINSITSTSHSPVPADARSGFAKNAPGLISNQPHGTKGAREISAVDSEHQLRYPFAAPMGATVMGDAKQLPDASQRPDFSPRAFSGPRDAFSAMEAAHATLPPTWIRAGMHHAEAGYLDPALGWVGVRADASGSAVHAALMPASAGAAQVLESHLSGLNAFLSEQHGPLATVTVGNFDSGLGGQGSGVSPGSHSDAGNSGREPPQPGRDEPTIPAMTIQRVSTADIAVVSGPASGGQYISVMA